MKTKVLALFAGMTLLMVNVTTSFAQPQLAGRGGFFLGQIVLEEIDLSDEQQASIQTILDSYQDKLDNAFEQMRIAHKNLNTLTFSDSSNEESLRIAASELGTQAAELAILQSQVYNAIKALLTEDQLSQLKQELAEDRRPHRQR